MTCTYQFLALERIGEVICARLKDPHVEDDDMENLGAELTRLIEDEKARKIVVSLGPEEPDCLISIFLAKLINLQRRLDTLGGALALAEVSDHTRNIFSAAGIEKLFLFYPNPALAAQALHSPG